MNEVLLLYIVSSIIEMVVIIMIIRTKLMNIIKKHWALILLVLYVIFSLIAYNNIESGYKGLLNKKSSDIDSIIKLSKYKQDSLSVVIDDGKETFAIYLKYLDSLNSKNRIKNEKINKEEKSLGVVNPDFNSNSEYISNSVNRFKKRNDPIR